MTDTRRLITLTATVALLLVAGTGCASDSDYPVESTSTSSAPTPSASAIRPQSESERAAAAAEDRVRSYFATLDDLRQNPQRPLDDLREVASSIQLSSQRMLLQKERRDRLRQVGETRIVEVQVQSVNLQGSDPRSGDVPTVSVDVCWDVAGADLVDENGVSVVSSERANVGWTRFTVANYQRDAKANGWRVASGQDLEKAPCSAA